MRRDRDLGGVNHEEMTGSGAYIRHLEGEPPREYTRHLRGASMGYTRHLGRSLHGDIPDTWGGGASMGIYQTPGGEASMGIYQAPGSLWE